ncbi:MAG: hypothetical protein ABIP55_10040 [Tepidisphaeraceae bacterium]
MVHEDIKGSQYPFTGKALHRDYQFLAVLADHAESLARQAYQLYTGQEPNPLQPAYEQDTFSWSGYDAAQDKLFKTERLRRLWLSTRRSQEMCNCALAHRLAQRLIAEKAPAADVLKQLDRAVELAKANQLISQINYDDDYDATEGLCAYLTEKLETVRAKYASNPAAAVAEAPVLFIPWEKQNDIIPPARAAKQPGLYLSTGIALTAEEDYYRTGVVFSVQAQMDKGDWKTIFRRGVGRRETGWQSWDIPLDTFPQQKPLRLRFVTDSYSRAMDRTWPKWKWALWGRPQLVRISPAGGRTVLFDFAKHIAAAQCFVRLDKDGKERAFDSAAQDSTGATFKPLGPDAMGRAIAKLQGEWDDLQWVSGFKKWGEAAPNQSAYTSYLGDVDSYWSYASKGEVSWETDLLSQAKASAIVFVASTDFSPAKAELLCENETILSFDTGIKENRTWNKDGCELRYLHGAEIPNRGISGVYILQLPAGRTTPGQPLHLKMRIPSGGAGWVMCHGFPNTLATVQQQLEPPDPRIPAIAAFTPHKQDQFGVTIAEFEVEV